jgi:serine/threonine protein kinase/tetratricopeptide (TPR) repeat protein
VPASGPDDPRLARAIEEYLAAERAGQRPSRDEFLARHPEIAAELAECLDGLAFIQGVGPQLRHALGGLSNIGDPEDDRPPPGPLGDFRIVRELGRGGMGVVYEAEQLSLGRRVALKVLPFAAALDPKQLRRFRNEALAAANLNHPHIVPVYAVGCERGVHYYAMQLIEGQTLAALIRDLRAAAQSGSDAEASADAEPAARDTRPGRAAGLSTERSHRSPAYVRAVAALGADAAEALEHAHQMGVVHRDVKPANLMVDARGHVWVADFGLAQFRGGPDLTLTGDLVGTLRYMAPEQAAAKHDLVDHRADVYALGVTLYELLTLTAAVPGRDREEALRRLLDGDRPNPRRLNPAVPRDLETVLLKATAREPGDRYATAQELADDLRRFLDGRPVAARRRGLARRAGAWALRHRPLVAVAGAALVFTAAGLAVSLAVVAAERTEAARQRDQARRAVEDMYTAVAERWLSQEPGLEEVQRQFLLKALRYHREFTLGGPPTLARRVHKLLKALGYHREFTRYEEGGAEPRAAAARAYRRVGDIQRRLEVFPDAERAYREAASRFRRLADENPARREFVEELAACHQALGDLLVQTKRHAAGEAEYRAAVALREQLLDGSADPARAGRDLGVSVARLGRALQLTGRTAPAADAFERAVGLLEGSADGAEYETRLAEALGYLAELRGGEGRREQALRLLERSVGHRRTALALRPRDPALRRGLADVLTHLGAAQFRIRDYASAERSYREALALRGRLADDFPLTPSYRADLARTHAALADLHYSAGNHPAAITSYRAAAELWTQLTRDHPASPGHARDLAWLLATCPETSVRDPERAVESGRRAVAMAPQGGDCRRALGAALLRAGDARAAVTELDRAVERHSGGDGREWLLLALAHARLGDREAARGLYDRAIKWLEAGREDVTLQKLRAEAASELGAPSAREK